MNGSGFASLAIIGPGLIGRSIALAVGERCPGVEVLTRDRGEDLQPVAAADLVILCAPVRTNIDILEVIGPIVSPAAIVSDVGSTKAAIERAASGCRFIGGHPIAGSASGGANAARADLFVGKNWILTRAPHTPTEDASRLERFVRSLGAEPVWMDAEVHDRLFAFVSHLPQLAISALMDVVASEVPDGRLLLAGPGLRDSTRLAASPAGIWSDVVATNRTAIGAALDALITALARLRDDPSGDVLRRTFERAGDARARLEGSTR